MNRGDSKSFVKQKDNEIQFQITQTELSLRNQNSSNTFNWAKFNIEMQKGFNKL